VGSSWRVCHHTDFNRRRQNTAGRTSRPGSL